MAPITESAGAWLYDKEVCKSPCKQPCAPMLLLAPSYMWPALQYRTHPFQAPITHLPHPLIAIVCAHLLHHLPALSAIGCTHLLHPLPRVSVVSVSAEVHVCRRLAQETGGSYGVALNESHLEDLMRSHAPPPPALPGQLSAELVRMGFPQRASEEPSGAVFVGRLPTLLPGGYTCPRCKARTQELPCRCHVCGLTLISSPHLARSYHHLFPVAPYDEVDPVELAALAEGAEGAEGVGACVDAERGAADGQANGAAGCSGSGSGAPWCEGGSNPYCYGCLRPLWAGDGEDEGGGGGTAGAAGGVVLRCPQCRQLFCFECDVYVHESLHNCPGCECGPEGPVVPRGAVHDGAAGGEAGTGGGHDVAAAALGVPNGSAAAAAAAPGDTTMDVT